MGIPLPRILRQDGSRWDKLRFRNAIHTLNSYSFVFHNNEVGLYSMHPMVHFWARERLHRRAQKAWSETASQILADSIRSEGRV